jgi:hypothetical protein
LWASLMPLSNGITGKIWDNGAVPILSFYSGKDDGEDEEDGVVGRFLRRCWLRGMPRCTAR